MKRYLHRTFLALLLVAIGYTAGSLETARRARASVSVGSGKPIVTMNEVNMERFMATQYDALGITTNAQRDAALAGLTQAQINAVVKALIQAFDLSPSL